MDRTILESNPHQLFEGMAVCSYAVGAERAVVYVRAEYPLAVNIMRTAIRDAMESPPASCRLCFVEIGGERKPVNACRVKARERMIIRTDTPLVRELQRSALNLLLSVHRVDCKNCPANRNCELQRMAKFLGVPLKVKHLDHIEREPVKALGHPLLEYDANRCVLCGRCILVCRQQMGGSSLLTFVKRGFDTIVGFLGERDPAKLPCCNCLSCVEVCPVGAIFPRHSQEMTPCAVPGVG
jgi:NADH dehydrogenase/NADH:ubiquinone oxidoreductase subunit G